MKNKKKKKQRTRTKTKTKNIISVTEAMLLLVYKTAAAFGEITLGAIEAGMTRKLDNEKEYWQAIKNDRELMRRNFYHLEQRGYTKRTKGNKFLITPKGKLKITKAKIKIKKKNKKWDGKWRIIIFDIPEDERGKRDDLRVNLKTLGFKRLQQSVWISPYDIDEELEEFIRLYNIRKYIISMICDSIDGKDQLERKFFNSS